MRRYLFSIYFLLIMVDVFTQGRPQFIFEPNSIQVIGHDSYVEIKVFREHISYSDTKVLNPIIGKTKVFGDTIEFQPIVPLNLDEAYTLKYGEQIQHFFMPVDHTYKRVILEHIFPGTNRIPSNQLKWFLKFSAPVSLTNIYDHIYFEDYTGKALDRAVLPLENVLGSEDGTAITIWMEPGRQKRGLGPADELGAVFQEGKKYSLYIRESLKDQNGIGIAQRYIQSFQVVKAKRTKPNINEAQLELPEVSTLSPMILKFKYPFDRSSNVGNSKILINGKEFRGQWRLETMEYDINFYPDLPWQAGNYEIILDPKMTDLAGNSFIRLFDQPLDLNTDNDKINNRLKFQIIGKN